MFPSTETVPIFGMEMSQAVGVGVVVGGASAAGSVAGKYILPMIQPDGLAQTEARVLNPALTAGATYLVANLFGSVPSPFPLIALGAGAEISGSYLWGTISPLLNGGKSDSAFSGGMASSDF